MESPEKNARSGGSDTRGRLLEAGLRLFSARGFDTVTTRQVAAEAQANVAAVAYHFGGMKELYTAVIEQLVSETEPMFKPLRENLLDELDQIGNEREALARITARFAEGLQAAGFEVLNEVTLNQVMVSFGDDATTARVIDAVQAEGTCWCGGTYWHGRAAMRISVSSWATRDEDVEQSLAAIIGVAGANRDPS